MKASEITVACLDKVKDTLVKFGWLKWNYGNCEKGYCLLGAYSKACFDWDIYEHDWEEPEEFLDDELNLVFGVGNILDYNDHPNTTFEDVLDGIERAKQRIANGEFKE